jgi:ribonuclease HI
LLYTDGAARGNPGPAAIGAVLYRDDDGRMHEVDTVSETIGVATNNVAEYKAVIAGLKMAAARTPQLLIVRADSLLLIRQLAGRYRVRNANLQPLHREAMELLAPMSYRLQHVRREQNTRADDLANAALDRG